MNDKIEEPLDGTAVVYCQGAFNTPNGKTAHGLVRRTRRYRVAAVVDRTHAGRDAGEVLDGRAAGIPVVKDLGAACKAARDHGHEVTHFVVGLTPDGGRLSSEARAAVRLAVERGLHVDCGLHDYLGDDPALVALAAERGVVLRDVRKPPPVGDLHFFTGKIEEVTSCTVALLGTDSAVGKRTTAWLLVDALQRAGYGAELVGTGQTAWMQGVRYGILLDSLINDFLSGEIEHAVHRAWNETRPDVLVVEGQGSLLNPAYPGGYEILAAARPDVVVLQHAPGRSAYDGFPAYPLHPLETQIAAVETVSGKPVVAVTLSHEGMTPEAVAAAARELSERFGLPVCDPLVDALDDLVAALRPRLAARQEAA